MAEGTIDKWEFTRDYAVATLDGGTTAEVRLRRQDGNGNTAEPPLIKNLRYFGVPRNDGFVLMPNEIQAYRVSPREVRDQPCHPCHICWLQWHETAEQCEFIRQWTEWEP